MRDVGMISIPASECLEAAGIDVAWNDVRLKAFYESLEA